MSFMQSYTYLFIDIVVSYPHKNCEQMSHLKKDVNYKNVYVLNGYT